MALHLRLSNSLEKLADSFAEKLCLPLMGSNDPFQAVYAVVPNSGMGMFLKRRLARRNNLAISANIETPFLQKFLTDRICSFFTEEECEAFRDSMHFWNPDVLSWRIDSILSDVPEEFPELSAYCTGDPVRRHLLACEFAENFDRYQLYRSSVTGNETLAQWRQGEEKDVQSRLYHKLCAQIPDPDSFYVRFMECAAPRRTLPERIGIFGLSTMPALYFHCLEKLAGFMEIHLFSPSPCQTYWGDIKSRSETAKELLKDPDHAAELLEESAAGNQLLADFGITGREFFNLLLDRDCFSGEDQQEDYTDPVDKSENALHLFQSDILNARNRDEKYTPAPDDRSVRINCCADARRELEILHDQLLELFYSKDKECRGKKTVKVTRDLGPEDVIVMFPDINKAAPMIDAVFSNGPFKGRYAICDRSSIGQSQVIESFNRLLNLPSARVTSEEILQLLEFGCINSKLKIAPEALPELADLVSRLRINWGLDHTEHDRFRMTPFEEFSWQDGIERLLTEYARGEDASVIYDSDKTGGIDGELAENFASLAEFIELLKEWRSTLHVPRTPEAWSEFTLLWINNFFSGTSKEYLPEVNELKRAAGRIAANAAAADENALIDSQVWIAHLRSEYASPGGKQHFLRDKITFCSLVPMRAIPAKVIAVLGLNDGAFPGVDRRNSFDLLSAGKRNDPNLTNDGRYLFLEALMAAQENLILSYVGFDNGEELAPAIPMAAVENVLKKSFGIEKVRIPLKAVELDFLTKLHTGSTEDSSEEEKALSELPPAALPEILPLKTLQLLLTQNCKGFFKIRCGFDSEKYEKSSPATDDPESLSNQDETTLQRALWSMRLADIDSGSWLSMVKRGRLLPVNNVEEYESAKELICSLPEVLLEEFRDMSAVNCSLQVCPETTVAALLAVPADFEKTFRRDVIHFSKFSPEKLLCFYLEQLLLAAHFNAPVTGQVIFTKEEQEKMVYTVPPEKAPAARLSRLAQIALLTFSEAQPLPIFANASYICCKETKICLAEFLKNLNKKEYSEFAEILTEEFIESFTEKILKELAGNLSPGLTEEFSKELTDTFSEEVMEHFRMEVKSKYIKSVKASFLKDAKYNSVIERFYNEDNFRDGKFFSLAHEIFSPVANMKAGEL